MKKFLAPLLLLSSAAHATETQMLPKGAWVLDVAYLHSTIDKQWDGKRNAKSLIDDIPRYEPGGGLQGVLSARPHALFQIVLTQILYGVTDWLTLALYLPFVLRTTIDANFRWTPGDYQGQLGRVYSEDDFWAWAASLGQPRPPSTWVGNELTFADILVGARVAIPEFFVTRKLGVKLAGTVVVALPTGHVADPEEVVAAGTTSVDLHAYGDLELHLAWDRPFLVDQYEVPRVNLGGEFYYAWLRQKTLPTATGARNPLLNTYSPYVGTSYTIDPGDWFCSTISLEAAPILGPAYATLVSGGDLVKAHGLPPLVTLNFSYTYTATGQSRWYSDSAIWDYDKEKFWKPGDKNTFRFGGSVSFLRMGVPVQLYAQYRMQDLIGGRFTRASDSIVAGARVVLKFW